MRITQEFYCGECDGYFLVRLNTSVNCGVEILCPNCGHKHRRAIYDGQVYEQGRYSVDVKETIMPPKSSYHKNPITKAMESSTVYQRRNGINVNYDMMMRWVETAQRERTGVLFDD